MTTIKASRIECEVVHNETREFAKVDTKGRRHGYQIKIVRERFVAIEETRNCTYYRVPADMIDCDTFAVIPQAMKDGKKWGALVPAVGRYHTLGEATEAMWKRFAQKEQAAR